MRGDIIVKIQEYDARDVRNIDAQSLFRAAGNHIRIVVYRDSKLIVASNMQNDGPKSRSPSAIPPYRPDINLMQYDFNAQAVNLLPKTQFQSISDGGSSRPNSRLSNFSPMPTRDHQQEVQEEIAAITTQVSLKKKPENLNFAYEYNRYRGLIYLSRNRRTSIFFGNENPRTFVPLHFNPYIHNKLRGKFRIRLAVFLLIPMHNEIT